jgi:hypothetical protein
MEEGPVSETLRGPLGDLFESRQVGNKCGAREQAANDGDSLLEQHSPHAPVCHHGVSL